MLVGKQYDGPPLFSIDVECVAGPGTCGCDRIPASVSVVDQTETVVYESAIKPSAEVSSYLTALTGLKESDLADAPELDAVVADIKDLLSEGMTPSWRVVPMKKKKKQQPERRGWGVRGRRFGVARHWTIHRFPPLL